VRNRSALAALAIVASLAAHAAAARPADHDEVLAGIAHAVDGDTLDLRTPSGRIRIRLFGMDAPEGKQLCRTAAGDIVVATQATAHMSWMVDGRELHCSVKGP